MYTMTAGPLIADPEKFCKGETRGKADSAARRARLSVGLYGHSRLLTGKGRMGAVAVRAIAWSLLLGLSLLFAWLGFHGLG
jgi:hypothetical protein